MDFTILRPSVRDLSSGDQNLLDLSAYIGSLLKLDDTHLAARNVSLAYLAFMRPLVECQCIQQSAIPALYLELRENRFEVGVFQDSSVN